MFNTISAHVKFIERNNILRKVISNRIICSELTGNGFFCCQKISNLNVELFTVFVASEVNLPVSVSASCYIVASAKQLQVDDIHRDEMDVFCATAKNRLRHP